MQKTKIKLEHSPIIFSGILLVLYSFGFLLWNVFLGKYDFFELSLLQTRFIPAGITFFIPVLVFIPYITSLYSDKKPSSNYFKSFLIGVIFSFYFTTYVYTVFEIIPQSYGGAQPFAVTLFGSPEQMSFLNKFNIKLVEELKYPIQTQPVCQIYSNDEIIILGISNLETRNGNLGKSERVIILNKNEIKGIQSISPKDQETIREDVCEGFLVNSKIKQLFKTIF